MIKNLSELKPCKSFLLGRIKDSSPPARGVVDALLDELSELLSLESREKRLLISRGNEVKADELFAGYIHYVEKQQAPWTINPRVVDETNPTSSGLQAQSACRNLHIGYEVAVSHRKTFR